MHTQSKRKLVVPTSQGVADSLSQNDCIGEAKRGPRRFWTNHEIEKVKQYYPTLGIGGCLPLLPGRTASSIYQRAALLKLPAPATQALPTKRVRRWPNSPHIDAAIRRVMARPKAKRGDIKTFAQSINRPYRWVLSRARALGIVFERVSAPEWSDAEIDILEAEPHLNEVTLQRRLKAAGFSRTKTAIKVKLKRLGACRDDPNHYTATGLAQLLGCDNHVATSWITKGWLKANRRGTQRTEKQGGDQWWIHWRDFKNFCLSHPAHLNLCTVDKTWFIDLIGARKD